MCACMCVHVCVYVCICVCVYVYGACVYVCAYVVCTCVWQSPHIQLSALPLKCLRCVVFLVVTVCFCCSATLRKAAWRRKNAHRHKSRGSTTSMEITADMVRVVGGLVNGTHVCIRRVWMLIMHVCAFVVSVSILFALYLYSTCCCFFSFTCTLLSVYVRVCLKWISGHVQGRGHDIQESRHWGFLLYSIWRLFCPGKYGIRFLCGYAVHVCQPC